MSVYNFIIGLFLCKPIGDMKTGLSVMIHHVQNEIQKLRNTNV